MVIKSEVNRKFGPRLYWRQSKDWRSIKHFLQKHLNEAVPSSLFSWWNSPHRFFFIHLKLRLVTFGRCDTVRHVARLLLWWQESHYMQQLPHATKVSPASESNWRCELRGTLTRLLLRWCRLLLVRGCLLCWHGHSDCMWQPERYRKTKRRKTQDSYGFVSYLQSLFLWLL